MPCVIISPHARRGYIAHGQYDHTSILKLIEWRFGLPPLSVRDQTANNLAEVLNFSSPPVDAPAFTVGTGPFGAPCPPLPNDPEAEERAENLETLRTLALKFGFAGIQ